jgi:phosphoenolpyruvate carboxylase
MTERPDRKKEQERRHRFLKLRIRELERHALSMEWMFYRMGFFLLSLSDEYPYLGEKMVASLKKVLLDEAEMVNEIYRRQIRRLESINAPSGLLEMIHAKKKEAEERVDELYDLPPRDAFREVEKKLRDRYRRFLEDKTNSFVLQELSLLGDADEEDELSRELEFLEELEDEENWGNYYSGLDDWEKPLDL